MFKATELQVCVSRLMMLAVNGLLLSNRGESIMRGQSHLLACLQCTQNCFD